MNWTPSLSPDKTYLLCLEVFLILAVQDGSIWHLLHLMCQQNIWSMRKKKDVMHVLSTSCSTEAMTSKHLIWKDINRTLATWLYSWRCFYRRHPPLCKGLGFAQACYNLHQTTSFAVELTFTSSARPSDSFSPPKMIISAWLPHVQTPTTAALCKAVLKPADNLDMTPTFLSRSETWQVWTRQVYRFWLRIHI